MEIRIKYQGIEGSPSMKEYFERQLTRFERFLSSRSIIFIELIHGPEDCSCSLNIQMGHSHFRFESSGADVFEAFTKTFEEACRCMRSEHQIQLNRIHRKLFIAKAINE
jgi:ribosome-associated translation inhibitor RaiA